MLNPIATLIENALDSHPDLAGNHANAVIAAKLANTLTVASWEQLAAVTGASLETDYSGQLVLYTGCYKAQADHTIVSAGEACTELLNQSSEEDAGWADPIF